MATNPTIKATVTAEDKGSSVLNTFSQAVDNVGKRLQATEDVAAKVSTDFKNLADSVAGGAGKFTELSARLNVVTQRMREAEANEKTRASTLMGLELSMATLQNRITTLGTAQANNTAQTRQGVQAIRELTGTTTGSSAAYNELNQRLLIVRQRMEEAAASGTTKASTMMQLERQAGTLTTKMASLAAKEEEAAKTTESTGFSFRNMAGAVMVGQLAANAAQKSFQLLVDGAKAAVSSTADYEQYRTSFEIMAGGADHARQMLQALSDFAVKTPFSLPEVVEGTKQIMAYGISAQEALPTIKMLGEVTAVAGMDKLPRLTLAYGQVRAAQKLYGTELRQFSEAGVPLLDQLAKQSGKSANQIRLDMQNEVGPSFKNVQDALVTMTSKGGMYYEAMEKQAQTFKGIMTNIPDQLGRVARSIMGISEGGDIRQGGPFYYLKEGAQAFLGFITQNAGLISSILRSVLSLLTAAIRGLVTVLNFIGPQFIIAGAAAVTFGIALAKVIQVGMALFAVIRTLSLSMMLGSPLGIAITVMSVLIGVVLYGAMQRLHSLMGNTQAKTKDLSDAFDSKLLKSLGSAGGGVDAVGGKIAKLNEQIKEANDDFIQSMAQMVKTSQDKVKDLTGQIDEEKKSFTDAQAQKAEDFKDQQDKMTADHGDRVKKIQDDIDKEVRMGVLADQYKLSDLRQKLDQENAEYDQQFSKNATKYQNDTDKAKAEHDKKLTALQKELDAETAMLTKHAADVAAVHNVTLLDELDKLKQSHERQMKNFEEEKNSAEGNTNDATSYVTNAWKDVTDQLTKNTSPWDAAGNSLGKAFANALKDQVKQMLIDVGTGMGKFFEENASSLVRGPSGVGEIAGRKIEQLASKYIFHRATGGPVAAGQPYMVGERGMELFVPNQSGTIVPNNQTSVNRNHNTTVNVSINAGAFMGSQIEARKYALMIMDAYQDAMLATGRA
jgi:tape measure domain-containing protein